MTPAIILISGKQGSGKTTLSSRLRERLTTWGNPVSSMKFAEPLYRMHKEIRSILQEWRADTLPATEIDGPLLQVLGTEWGRKTRGEDFWANLARRRVENFHAALQQENVSRFDFAFYIFDDCRFENELHIFKGLPYITIRLNADENIRKTRAEKWRPNTDHPSEVGLDHVSEWNLQFNTNQTPADEVLETTVAYIAARFQ
jgi:hypothetical protein